MNDDNELKFPEKEVELYSDFVVVELLDESNATTKNGILIPKTNLSTKTLGKGVVVNIPKDTNSWNIPTWVKPGMKVLFFMVGSHELGNNQFLVGVKSLVGELIQK